MDEKKRGFVITMCPPLPASGRHFTSHDTHPETVVVSLSIQIPKRAPPPDHDTLFIPATGGGAEGMIIISSSLYSSRLHLCRPVRCVHH